uniref:ALG1 chitobiosyldiphosphodolichol beta-mannosyltransferase n=1 Tax=Kryptolebias marmoratus TaxID=37003 RepID=A0A3Q3A7L0_KRYMA
MQYHALSLSRHGFLVTFVGFLDTKPHQDVLNQDNIRIVSISEVKGVQGPSQNIPLHGSEGSASTCSCLFGSQNPPGLPGIAVAWLVSVLRGSGFIIDWHNYGFSIMALSLGPTHPVVRLAKWYEHFFGALSSNNLCVTEAMKEDLQTNWGVRATTLYDRPASIFRETPLDLRHQLFITLAHTHPQFQNSGSEPCVGLMEQQPCPMSDASCFLSTEDEDFSVLLKALEEYEGFIRGGASLPSLFCVITGKGPQKGHYRKLIDSLHLEHVKICIPWLEAEDYPLLLGWFRSSSSSSSSVENMKTNFMS